MEKDITKPSGYFAIIISLLGIILTIIGKINFQTLIILIVLTISAVTFSILAFYINKTNQNSEELDELKRNINILKRIDKLELKVFKNER